MSRPGVEPGPPAGEASTLEKSHPDSLLITIRNYYIWARDKMLINKVNAVMSTTLIALPIVDSERRLVHIYSKAMIWPYFLIFQLLFDFCDEKLCFIGDGLNRLVEILNLCKWIL